MQYEYDPHKSAANKEKHGIDFEEAQALWDDPRSLEIHAAYKEETRYAVIGMIGELHWTAIITYRGGSIRIISCRRARTQEVALYGEE